MRTTTPSAPQTACQVWHAPPGTGMAGRDVFACIWPWVCCLLLSAVLTLGHVWTGWAASSATEDQQLGETTNSRTAPKKKTAKRSRISSKKTPRPPKVISTSSHHGKIHTVAVTATGFSSTGDPGVVEGDLQTAFGRPLRPGERAIAVSRDLHAMGLTYNTPVRIRGREGVYYVKDLMPSHWNRRIDIYFGHDSRAMDAFGSRQTYLEWGPGVAAAAQPAKPRSTNKRH